MDSAFPVPAVSGGRLGGGGRLDERGGRGGGGSRVATRADPKNGSTRGAPVVTCERLGSRRDRRKTDGFSGLTLLPPGGEWEYVGVDTPAHLARAMIVIATRVRLCEVLSMRSKGRKSSSCRSPLAEHDARKFITFNL